MNLSPIRASRPVAAPAPARARSALPDLAALQERASEATAFLKALSHEGRLLILCHLGEGERSVTELEQLLGARQSAVSQQLARLRLEGLVDNRRDGKTIYYRIADPRARALIASLHDLFCAET